MLPSKVTSTHSESVLPPAARVSSTLAISEYVAPSFEIDPSTLERSLCGTSRSSMCHLRPIRIGHSSSPPELVRLTDVAVAQRVSLASPCVAKPITAESIGAQRSCML